MFPPFLSVFFLLSLPLLPSLFSLYLPPSLYHLLPFQLFLSIRDRWTNRRARRVMRPTGRTHNHRLANTSVGFIIHVGNNRCKLSTASGNDETKIWERGSHWSIWEVWERRSRCKISTGTPFLQFPHKLTPNTVAERWNDLGKHTVNEPSINTLKGRLARIRQTGVSSLWTNPLIPGLGA